MNFCDLFARRLGLSAFVLLLLVSLPVSTRGEEPIQQFLEALRASYEFDIALEYLDEMETSPLAPESFKERIALERTELLVLSVGRTRDPRKREELLNQAQATLEEFLKSSPAAELRSTAERTRASLLIARAGMLVEKTKSDRATADQKSELRSRARTFLENAGKSFEANRLTLRKEIESMMGRNLPNEKTELMNLQAEYIRVRRMSPSIKEKIADTYDADDPNRKKMLDQAASEFADLFEKYASRPGGLDSALYAARCYMKLEEYDKALAFITTDIFSQEDVPAFYEIKKQAAGIAMTCWESKEPFQYAAVVEYLRPIILTIKPTEKRDRDWLRLKLGFAKACKLWAEQIRTDGPQDADERKKMNQLEDVAIDFAREVSKVPGPNRDSARTLLSEWNKRVGNVAETKEPPKTLGEARDQGREFIADIEDLANKIKVAESEIAQGADPAALNEVIAKDREELNQTAEKALASFDLALSLANETTPADDVSFVRYLQAYCYSKMDRFLETTIIGRFLFDKYPDSAGAREAMALVCKSNWKLYSNAQAEQKPDELLELKKNCLAMLEKWPDSQEADTAAQLMTIVSLQEGNGEAASKYFASLSEGSSAKDTLFLSMGQSTWQRYLRAQKAGEPREKLNELRDQAKDALEQGIMTIQRGSLSSFQARALLSLTELYLDEGNVDAALNQLEKAEIAPLDLVKQKHPSASDSKYRLDTYRVSVRCYLSALQKGENTQAWIEKAQNVIDALAAEFESQEGGEKKLVAVYYRLAKELKGQFDAIEDPAKLATFGEGLDVFLSGVAKNSNETQILIWCASTMSSVGTSLVDAGAMDQGRTMFEKSIEVFDRVRDSGDSVDENVKREMARRKALAYRGMGKYQDAMKQFEEIMKDPANRRFIDLQIDATETFQAWAEATSDPKIYIEAVMGGLKIRDLDTGKNKKTVMGWQAITSQAKSQRKEPLIARAVYNLAKCKYQYGKIISKDEYVKSAAKEIELFKNKYPNMGGQEWKEKFDNLLAEISG